MPTPDPFRDAAAFDRGAWEAQLRDAVQRFACARADGLEGAFDRLVCEDVDLERMKTYRAPNGEEGLLVDEKKAYVTHTTPELRGEKYLIVTTGRWVGEWARLNPELAPPEEIDVEG